MRRPASLPWHRRLPALLPAWLHRRLLRFEAAIEDEVSSFARSLPPGTRVLDAGAGEGRYAHLFAGYRYVGVDLGVGDAAWDYSRLDARAALERLPFPDGAFGAALNIVVLEHTRDPGCVLAEIARVLEAGAPLLLVVPQEWGVHQAPHDYFRFTRHGLQWLLERAGFLEAAIDPVGGFFTLLGRRLLEAALFFRGGWRWLLFPLAAALAGPAGLLLPALDFLDREKHTTLGYICRARRRG
ncbi:MAG: class I SAM-dependent methyltransferase [Acidobacteria bacterium]|nr:class I SAM-dependent methyltransferase [Acidobacteriota bacterium]